MKLKKKDTVLVLSGKDKGKRGEILQILAGLDPRTDEPTRMRVLVSKVNMITKHNKPRQNQPGGIQKMEAPIPASKVMLVCPKCNQPTRPKLDQLKTGERVRVCRGCAEVIL